ncbi:MAG: deoxyribodipyrimidine photolyase [Myxococcales bacterium]|nr:deoxyribodipyrimidine photolyase [Myxococcales bacterium]
MSLSTDDHVRVTACNQAPTRPDGEFVLYWMIAHRRARWNFSLDRAVAWSRELNKPLVVLEALRTGYRWASDRIHRFIIDGMRDNSAAFASTPALYHPYVEPKADHGQGLLAALASRACVVVTDDFPCFFLPRMVSAAADALSVRLEQVDANGVYPMRATDRLFNRAVDLRRHLQKTIHPYLTEFPRADPFDAELPRLDALPSDITERWPRASEALLAGKESLDSLPIDHSVPPVPDRPGGSRRAAEILDRFFDDRLVHYADGTRDLMDRPHSALSPYLHLGHISAHEIFHRVVERERWTPDDLSTDTPRGKREGWWGMSAEAESFLDELITWREIGYNRCCHQANYADFDALPDWALKTLDDHRDDPRPTTYTLEQFEQAQTHDRLWNAAQTELKQFGSIHSYVRMLWGKKVLHWTERPEDALKILIELNNKYALDGRNPNSYSGIMWCFGRFDRAWGPEREIFGKVRYMTSDSTARKFKVTEYQRTYRPDAAQGSLFG